MALPGCAATMIKVPAIRDFAVAPVSEHTIGVEEVWVTGKLEVAVATSVAEVSTVGGWQGE